MLIHNFVLISVTNYITFVHSVIFSMFITSYPNLSLWIVFRVYMNLTILSSPISSFRLPIFVTGFSKYLCGMKCFLGGWFRKVVSALFIKITIFILFTKYISIISWSEYFGEFLFGEHYFREYIILNKMVLRWAIKIYTRNYNLFCKNKFITKILPLKSK